MIILPISALNTQQWKAYFEWFQRITKRFMPREWVGEWQQFRKRKLANLEISQTQEYVWQADHEPYIWLRLEVASGKAMFDWNADPGRDPLSEELIGSICHLLAAYLDRVGQKEITVETGTPFMPQLASFTQAKLINERYFYEFNRKEVEKEELKQTVLQFRRRHPDISFEIYENRPSEILAQYIALYNIVAADIPRADAEAPPYQSWPADALEKLNKTNRATGNLVLTGVLRNERGALIGLSDLNIHVPHPVRLYQGMTGIHPAYRGNGFGSWLKTAMLHYAWEAFPPFEIIDTDCNALNYPVQKMNEQMGFVRTGQGWEYRIERKHLDK